MNWVADLPFGHGKKFGHDSPGWVNAIIGEWSFAGLWRWTSGFPFNVFNCRSCWATNWNLQGNASLVTPGVLPPTGTTLDAVNDLPSPFTDPKTAPTSSAGLFGRVGHPQPASRRRLYDRHELLEGVDMPWAKDQKLRFRWDIFNITNTPRMDVGNVTMFPDRANTFGT